MTFERFFDSETKVRLIKFFLLNHSRFFEVTEIAHRLGLPTAAVKASLKQLKEEGFVKSRSAHSFSISYRFPYLAELKALILKFPIISDEWVLKEIKRLKRLKLFLVAGALIHAEKARVEVLIVGDKIRERTAETFMKQMEAQAARELRYVVLTTQEFLYRKKMFDRFVLDVLEFPHRALVNKLKI